MSRRERSDSRWKISHQQNPTTGNSRLLEPVQEIRRSRQHRLSGSLFAAANESAAAASSQNAPLSHPGPGADMGARLGAMRFYYEAVRHNGNSYTAWIGLSCIFESFSDRQRADQCRGVARRLRRLTGLPATG